MISRLRTLRSGLVGAALLFAAALGAQAIAPTNVERVSVSPTEAEGNLASGGQSGVSADGRYVIFASEANNFGAGFSGGSDIYVRDRQAGFTELVSRGDAQTAGGRIANGASDSPSISSSGRYAAFATLAGNLVATAAGAAIDTNGRSDIYFRDRRGAVVWVSPAPANAVGDGASTLPKISGDGGTVVFQSTSTNLTAGDTNVLPDVFAATLTMSNGLPQLFSVRQVSSTNVVANGASTNADVSEDGSLAVFQSAATNLVTGDDNGETDIFLRDLSTGAIRIVSRATDEDETPPGELGDGPSTNPAISADGRFVAFLSEAANLVEVDANDKRDVFVRDLVTNTTTRVSINDEEIEGDEDSGPVIAPATQPVPPDISDDGNVIVFTSAATNLVEDDTNEQEDVFAHDVTAGSTSRVSVGNGNVEADLGGSWPSLSGSGRHASFATASTNLADEDLNAQPDIYLATLGAGSGNNSPPVADAGFDFEAPEFETVTLDGSGTFDLDEDELTFLWTQMGGPDVELNGATTDSPFFDAPIVAESATLVFQLEVSDGINPPVTDAVTVTINPASAAVVEGNVTTGDGTPVEGARVTVVRADGEAATETETDENGDYFIDDVRVGDNTLTVDAEGFEPEVREITVAADDAVTEDIVLRFATATLKGRVQLADGRPLATAEVTLLDGNGLVRGEARTDAKGNYTVRNLDRFDLNELAVIRVRHPSVVDWLVSDPNLTAGTQNTLNFRFGTLRVTVDTRPASLRRRLGGTTVEILSGGQVVASNGASRTVRTLLFANVPATALRVRARNPALTGAQVEVTVPPGPRVRNVKIFLRGRGRF